MGIQSALIIPDDSQLSAQLGFQQTIYNFFMQASGIFCVLRCPEFVFELANPSFLHFTGKRDLIGKAAHETLTETGCQGFSDVLHKVYNTKVAQAAEEMRFVFSNQGETEREVYANFMFQPALNTKGEVVGIVVSGYDITERMNARRKVEELEERMRLAVDVSNIGIYDYNLLTDEIVSSEIMYRIFGSEVPLTAAQYGGMIEAADEEKFRHVYENALKSGKLNHQSRVRMASGEKRWIDTTAKVFYDSEGTAIRLLGTIKDITENKIAEEKMAMLAAIVESSEDLILSKGLDGIITSWNAAGERIMGYKADEMIGQHVSKLIPTDRLPEEDEIIRRLKIGERIEHFETQRIRKDGQIIDISLTISPVKNKKGETTGASKIARDITPQKNSERMIAENEERLKILIDASELGTWELNLETGEIWYSEKYLEMFGYKENQTPNHNELIEHLHPEDRAIRINAMNEAWNSGVLKYAARLIWNDRTIHWIDAQGKVLYDEQGQPYKMVGTLRDITAEMNYRRELESREQKFRLLADSMPQIIWTSDAEGNMSYFNQAMYDYSGLSSEQLMSEGWLLLVRADEKQPNQQDWLKAVGDGELFKKEHLFRRADGQYRWQLSRAIPQKDEEGNIIMWVGTSTDVHDWKVFTNQLEAQVQQRTKQLEESNEELSKLNNELAQFAYVASHDLQEPLRKIQTFSARIQEIESGSLSEKGKDYFNRLQNASRRMQQLILDLLAYSRANTAERHYEELNLGVVIEGVTEQLKETIQQKKAIIQSVDLPTLKIVRYQFEQLFTNLFSNALKFSKADVPPLISIESEVIKGSSIEASGINKDIDYYHISIADNGIGFESEYKETIFQVFKRLHGKDEYPGTGIGLAIVKKIIDNHSGAITATAILGEGATFDMYFPVETV